MDKEPSLRLIWHGRDTVRKVPELLAKAESVEITLPSEYHHVLYCTFHPDAEGAGVEELDEQGGAELLERIASVRGLEEIDELHKALAGRSPQVKLQSPAQLIITLARS